VRVWVIIGVCNSLLVELEGSGPFVIRKGQNMALLFSKALEKSSSASGGLSYAHADVLIPQFLPNNCGIRLQSCGSCVVRGQFRTGFRMRDGESCKIMPESYIHGGQENFSHILEQGELDWYKNTQKQLRTSLNNRMHNESATVLASLADSSCV
jgi:hypothetical protein